MHEISTIQQKLAALLGQVLWDGFEVAGILCLRIGEKRLITNRKQQEVEIGRYSLHISGVWRFWQHQQLIIADGDWAQPDPAGVEPSALHRFLHTFWPQSLFIRSIQLNSIGDVQLHLSQGYCLELLISSTNNEYWRLIDNDTDEHFIVEAHDDDDSTENS
ncbi:MAG TPA: hypothetical protein DEF47_13875 [Herpetosiphon sp.]|uniref:Uncharacterized protein n=1 Tax=Herpetosiphon aurantiacus (strain ATCC 23779 / DSM 785 / 114-95) TaxID=316274 RepID=A9AZN3_HERA2|nr:hypothetical protein [Herpetosiphon sp.]ABX07087.1 hypothetical protein Haur_4455 [Herpetosiphon aurantiacus DSM 785]HBW50977.1 hypothetical protein [Herpetosiphon sp.]